MKPVPSPNRKLLLGETAKEYPANANGEPGTDMTEPSAAISNPATFVLLPAYTNQFILDELIPNMGTHPPAPSLGHRIVKLARLGGCLARARDPPPDNTVIWKGMSRLTDIELGIMIGVQLVGN